MGFPLGRIAAVSRFHPWPFPAGLDGRAAFQQPLKKKGEKKGAHWTPSQK
jgi:hypothetical protein